VGQAFIFTTGKIMSAINMFNTLQHKSSRIDLKGVYWDGEIIGIHYPGWNKDFLLFSTGEVYEAIGDDMHVTYASKWLEGVANGKVRNDAGELVDPAELAPKPVEDFQDPYEDPMYLAFVEEMAQYCHCDETVCGSVLCGGLCESEPSSYEPCSPEATCRESAVNFISPEFLGSINGIAELSSLLAYYCHDLAKRRSNQYGGCDRQGS
jgi:hypothetical protein